MPQYVSQLEDAEEFIGVNKVTLLSDGVLSSAVCRPGSTASSFLSLFGFFSFK